MTIDYRTDFNLWWPDWDTKPEANHAYILQHLPDMDYAINQCKQHKVAVQAGGHVGLWPIRLSDHFENVVTFEPEQDLYECMHRNLEACPGITYCSNALGAAPSKAWLKRSGSSGSNRLNDDAGDYEVTIMPLDSFLAEAEHCDVIFLDVEHYERQALEGAVVILNRFHPVLQIEELTEEEGLSVWDFLKPFGYVRDVRQGKDRIYLPV